MNPRARPPSLLWSLGLFCLLAAPARAEEPTASEGKTRIVVYRLKSEPELQGVAEQLSDDMLLHLGQKADISVIGESEIQLLLSHEKDKRVLMCEDEQKCLSKLSTAIQADNVITGHLGKVGETFMVTLKLANAAKATVERGEAAQGDTPAELAVQLRAALDRMLGDEGSDEARFQMTVAPEGTKVAVIDLASHGVAPQLGENLTQLLSLELKKSEGLSVISRDEIQTLLRFEAEKQILKCTSDTSCLVEIGGALGVDYLVSGSVGLLGDAFVITLKLMDVHEAVVVSRASESFRGPESELPQALRFATRNLLGQPMSGAGSLAVQANVKKGELIVGSEDPRPYPLPSPLDGLSAGKYGISMRAQGYEPTFQETYVTGGLRTDLRLQLTALPLPWYKRWYTWTAVGAAIAAATITTVVLLNQNEPAGSVAVTVH
ncbi:MAG: hypothetical protein H6744_20185 [Deltaproteobacteria bacterium]|nr:hypothetical protein [Deltaproteobacteria bacterium]